MKVMREKPRALILFGHGSRDENWRKPYDALQKYLKQQNPGLCVKQAFLAMMPPTLAEVVAELEGTAYVDITIVPIFIGQGEHVCNDFSALVENCRKRHPKLTIKTKAAIGESEAVLVAIAQYCLE